MKMQIRSILLDDFSFSFFFSSLSGFVTLIILLLLAAGLVMIIMPNTRSKGINLYRIMVGGLFIFSGFVKADDPLGFSYKLTEYFEAFGPGWKWAIPFSLTLASIIPVVEMVVGFMTLLGTRKKLTLWLLFLMDLFFTFLTFYTAHYNKVLECGCFGDAIPMTPWVTFWKDVVLLAMIVIIALGNKSFGSRLSIRFQNVLVIVSLLLSSWFAWHCYNYLPMIDFRPYKIGTDIKKDMQGIPDVLKWYYTYKNKKTGETKEFENAPTDTANWDMKHMVSYRTETVKKGIDPKIKDFNIISMDGVDMTDSVLTYPDYTILMICSTFDKTNKDPELFAKVNTLADECMKHKVKFMCLTGSVDKDLTDFKQWSKATYPFYGTDETVLRTMIRANPGFIMIKAGIVIDMWHYHSLPDYKSLNEKYFRR